MDRDRLTNLLLFFASMGDNRIFALTHVIEFDVLLYIRPSYFVYESRNSKE